LGKEGNGYTIKFDWADSLEIAELIYLYESLRDFEDPRLKSRFQSIIKGPELLQDDMTGDSRDIQFELQIAVLLFRVKINKLQFHSQHDLVCSLHHNPLVIECKRPRKNRTLRDAYAKAAHQIETSDLVSTNPNTKGIVALDLTQIVVPALTGSRYPSLKEMENAFLKQLMKAWYGLQITISDYSDRVSGVGHSVSLGVSNKSITTVLQAAGIGATFLLLSSKHAPMSGSQ
jgi:hypothetical protein